MARPDRFRVDADQSYQCGAQGDRRQWRGPAPGPHHRPQGIPVRRRGQASRCTGWHRFTDGGGRRIGCDSRTCARPSRQAVDRRAGVPESERRRRTGVFRRRRGGRHHHRVVADPLAVRDRAQFELHLQGPRRGRETDQPRARRALRAGRQRAQGREPGAHHRPAGRCVGRNASVGGALRRQPRRHLRTAGPDRHQRRRRNRAATGTRRDRARQAQADGKSRRLRLLPARNGGPASGHQGGHRPRRWLCSAKRSSSIRISPRPTGRPHGVISGARSMAGAAIRRGRPPRARAWPAEPSNSGATTQSRLREAVMRLPISPATSMAASPCTTGR